MAYKTCENCGSRIYEYGCVNCNEDDYITMQQEYTPPKRKRYKDSVHGFEAEALSITGAWQLIRNKCHELKIDVPTMDKVFEITI